MNADPSCEPTLMFEPHTETCETDVATTPVPRKPRLWTAFVTFFAAVIVGQVAVIATYFTIGVGVGFVMGAQGADAANIQTRVQEIFMHPLISLLILFLPCQFGMAAVVWYAARRSNEPVKERLGFVPQTGRKCGAFKLASLAAFTVSVAWASLIACNLLFGAPASADPVTNAVAGGSWFAITLASIVLCIIPVFVEEFLFRGYLQRRFLERWSPALAISVSTLLFALIHLDSLQHVIAVVALGFVTGLLAYRTNSVKPGMIVHAIHNTVVVGFATFAPMLAAHLGEELLGMIFLGMIGALGLVGLPAVVSLVRRSQPRPTSEPTPTRNCEPMPNFAFDSQLASGVA